MPARSCFKVVARIHAGEKGGVKSMVHWGCHDHEATYDNDLVEPNMTRDQNSVNPALPAY